MLYISWLGFPLHQQWPSLSWRPLIFSKAKEENLVAGEKNPLPQLRRPRDRAIFGILFVMESGMPKTLLLFDHDKEAYNICVHLVWNKIRSNKMSSSK